MLNQSNIYGFQEKLSENKAGNILDIKRWTTKKSSIYIRRLLKLSNSMVDIGPTFGHVKFSHYKIGPNQSTVYQIIFKKSIFSTFWTLWIYLYLKSIVSWQYLCLNSYLIWYLILISPSDGSFYCPLQLLS